MATRMAMLPFIGTCARTEYRRLSHLPKLSLQTIIPDFLLPNIASINIRPSYCRTFAATTPFATKNNKKCVLPLPKKETNKQRGVSAIRRTGPRHRLSVHKFPLPKPAPDPHGRSQVEVDEDHGLWGFFGKDRTALATPEKDAAHGRHWYGEELRSKSWEDLHALWWVCMKERNRISTSSHERERLKAGFGREEAKERDRVVRRTQIGIRHILIERWYAYNDARKLAARDPTIDLFGNGPVYDAFRLRAPEGDSEDSQVLEGDTRTSEDVPKLPPADQLPPREAGSRASTAAA